MYPNDFIDIQSSDDDGDYSRPRRVRSVAILKRSIM